MIMTAVMVASVMAASAQKSTLLVGGNVDFTSAKDKNFDSKSNSFELNPTIGYQFNNNWTAGITGTIGTDKTESLNTENKQTLFAGGPFIRYAHPMSETFAVYGQLEGLFGGGKNTTTITAPSSSFSAKYNKTQINLFPALFINFKKSFGLNFNIGGLSYESLKFKGAKSSTGFNFNFGKVVGIGISKNFTTKK